MPTLKNRLEEVGPALNRGIASIAKNAMADSEVITKSTKATSAPVETKTQSIGRMTDKEKKEQEARGRKEEKPAKKRTYYGD